MKTWTIYRDGWRWTVGAKHLADALRRACLQTDAMSGQQYVDAGSRREPCEAPAPEGLPIALRCFAVGQIEAIYCDGLTVHIVDVSDTITHAMTLDVLTRAREHFATLRATANATRVPAALRFYKTGAKGLSVRVKLGLHVVMLHGDHVIWSEANNLPHLLAELESEGLLKWPRKTSAEEKARVFAGVVHNAALDEYVTSMQATLVFDTERTCALLVPPPKRVDEMTEAEMRERKAQHEAELATLYPGSSARHEIAAQLVTVQRRLDVFDSAREHGFNVGEVVDVLPAPWDDEQITRRARVVEVVVEHNLTYFGREPETQHRRVVEFFDGSESIRPEVNRLRPTTS